MKNTYTSIRLMALIRSLLRWIGVFVLFTIPLCMQASHAVGGAIQYKWLTGNTYEVTLTFYSDCGGISVGSTQFVNIGSVSCAQSFSQSLNLVSSTEVTPICASNNTTCNNGSLPGYLRSVYKGNVTFPAQCNDWVISFSNCCRNAAITNLTSPATGAIYFETKLDNLNFTANNSPLFSNSSNFIFASNSPQTLSLGAYDTDGDSLVYMLLTPKSSATQSMTHVTGLSAQYPFFTTTGSVGFNSLTGQFTFTANTVQVAVLAMRVMEYRNGVQIGYVDTDIQLTMMAGSNSLPTVYGIDSTGSYTHIAYAGDTVQLDIPAYDMDTAQTVSISWDTALVNGTMTVSGSGNTPAAHITWITDTSHISSQPYAFTLKLEDNNCPYYGTQTYSFYVWVNADSNTRVWPGDANNDLIANNYDFLSLGIAYGNTGPVRPNASIAWIGQPALNWAGAFASTVNHKYADCNGDGIIDTGDAQAIVQNYGLTHNKLGSIHSGGGPLLTLEYLTDSIESGDTAKALIILGDTANPLVDFYGLAFTLQYDHTLIDSGTVNVTFNQSWIGNPASNVISMQKDFFGQGMVDVAVTRTDKIAVSGSGSIGMLTHVMRDDIAGKQQQLAKTLQVNMYDGTAIKDNEDRVTLTLGADSVVVYQEDSYLPELPAELISVFPNPTNGSFVIRSQELKVFKINMFDMVGNGILFTEQLPSNHTSLAIPELMDGLYLLEIYTQKGIIYKKLLIAQ